LRLLFKKQKKLRLSSVFKWLDISELNMPKLIDLCDLHFPYAPSPRWGGVGWGSKVKMMTVDSTPYHIEK
jgi:hypothetical protein